MIVRAIALRFGYVESNSLGLLVFTSHGMPARSREEALQSLAKYLLAKFNPPIDGPKKKCCQSSLKKDPAGEYCSKCGKSVKTYFPLLEWYEYLEGLLQCDIDGYGYSDEPENPQGWDPSAFAFGIADQPILFVQENAAKILTLALMAARPELKKMIDDDFESPEEYIEDDYNLLINEDEKDADYGDEVVSYYATGAMSVKRGDKLVAVVYNTGDRIWFGPDGKKVVKISTHDGIEWQDPDVDAPNVG